MSLKEILGEDLYNQVIEKTGDNKLAIVSDGNWIPKDKFDEKNNDLKTLQGQLTDLQSTLETKETELSSVDDIKKELEKERLTNLKTSVAVEAGIPLKLASRLSGATEEEIKADAESLSSYVNRKQPLPLKHTEPKVEDKDAGLKKMIGNITKEN